MTKPKATKDLYGEAYAQLDLLHGSIRRFRDQLAELATLEFSCKLPEAEAKACEESPPSSDCTVYSLPQQATLAEFRYALASLRTFGGT